MTHESKSSSALVKKLKAIPGAIAFKHNDMSTAGIPDISFTYLNQISWIEVKLGNRIVGRELQHDVLLRLLDTAYYVVYATDAVYILRPSDKDDFSNAVGVFKAGAHADVADWFQRLHAARI